jgi:diacylglycerol kinase (ATP)
VNTLGPIRPDRVLLLVNPLSFRLSLPGAFARLRRHCSNLGLEPHVVYGPREIEPVLAQSLSRHLDLIVIVGGDGTLQGTVTLLATQYKDQIAPPILMLGGGRTNYTAAHLGTARRPELIIERILASPDGFALTEQASLKVSQVGHPDTFGFFLGGAMVDHIIRDCHQYRANGRGRIRQGRYSTILRVIQLGFLGLIGRFTYESKPMRISEDQLGTLEEKVRLLVATTLDKHQVAVHPYLPLGAGQVKLTAITRQARHFWRYLPRLLRGRWHPIFSSDNGYFSGSGQRFVLHGLSSICVDGQEYEHNPNETVFIAEGPKFKFVVS